MCTRSGRTIGGRSRWRRRSARRRPRSIRSRKRRRSNRRAMTEPKTTSIEVNGYSCRVWTAGSGPKLGFLAGFGGLPKWIPFLDALAKERTVIVPSLPGFPGGERGHSVLDNHLDWVLAAHELVRKAGLDGADLAGCGIGSSFAAEIAAIWPQSARRLALIAP